MNKKMYVILILVDVILTFCCMGLCNPDSLLDFLETDPDTFMDVFYFSALFFNLLFILITSIFDIFSLIFSKIRKSLEKQGKE